MLRSRRAPRSAAISCSPAAAAAAPRSRRLLPSRAPQPVPRCRLGSGGRRRSSSPARPGPRGPSRWRGDSGAPPSCRGAEKEESGEGDQYIPGRGGGAVGRSPGSRRRHPPPTPTPTPHTSARGAETAGVGGGGPGRAPPRTRTRASLTRTPSTPARPAPAPIPAAAWPAAAAGPLPSPFSPEPRTGAGRAPELLLASGKPRRSGSSSCSPRPRVRRSPAAPAHLPGSSGCRDLRARGAPSPDLSSRTRTSPQPGPRASI